jgi:hypothetical protein
MQQILITVLYYNNSNIILNITLHILMFYNILALYILPFTIEKSCNNAAYVFKYQHSLKMAINNSRNIKESFYIQQLAQFVGTKLVCMHQLHRKCAPPSRKLFTQRRTSTSQNNCIFSSTAVRTPNLETFRKLKISLHGGYTIGVQRLFQ